MDFATLELERVVAKVPDGDIDETLEHLADNQKQTKPLDEPRAAVIGDVIVIDFVGSIDGKEFAGGRDRWVRGAPAKGELTVHLKRGLCICVCDGAHPLNQSKTDGYQEEEESNNSHYMFGRESVPHRPMNLGLAQCAF